MPIWTDSDFAGLPSAPTSNDKTDVAQFVDERLTAINLAMKKHQDRRFDELKAQIEKMHACMLSAYPNGDPSAHRAAHEAQIAAKDTMSKLKMRVMAALLGWATIGSASAIGWALIRLFLEKGSLP